MPMSTLKCACLLLICIFSSLSGKPGELILDELVNRCREVQLDSALITHNDRVVLEYKAQLKWQPLDAQGITGSMTCLAIGFLIDEGKIQSIDTPVYVFFPEWDQGNKAKITLRDLLSNTSGLYVEGTIEEIHKAPDCVQQALCADIVNSPGWCCRYNRKGINLLAAVVEKVAEQPLSQYLQSKLFNPLGCECSGWLTDPSQNEYGMSHLIISAPDLVKIGKLIQQEGYWEGGQLISKKWIKMISSPGQRFNPYMGLLWYLDYTTVDFWWDEPLLAKYEARGINRCFVNALRSLQGRVLTSQKVYMTSCGPTFLNEEIIAKLGGHKAAALFVKQVYDAGLPLGNWQEGPLRSVSAWDENGQELVIYPDKKVITVRQLRGTSGSGPKGDPFPDFNDYVRDLIYCMDLYR